MKRILLSLIVGITSIALIAVFSPGGVADAMQHHVPRVEAYAATQVTNTSATINGWVRGYGSGDGHAWFEYGTYENVGNENKLVWSGKAGVMGITGATAQKFSANIINLQPNTTYYVKVRAENTIGENWSNVITFKTRGSSNTSNSNTSTTCKYTCSSTKVNSDPKTNQNPNYTYNYQYYYTTNNTTNNTNNTTNNTNTNYYTNNTTSNTTSNTNVDLTSNTTNNSYTYQYQQNQYNYQSQAGQGQTNTSNVVSYGSNYSN